MEPLLLLSKNRTIKPFGRNKGAEFHLKLEKSKYYQVRYLHRKDVWL